MTTIDITGAATIAPRTGRTRLRLTARGRRVLALVVAVPVAVVISFAILSGGGALASGDAGAPADAFSEVTVMPGDTLWSIAESAAPDADPRDVVDEIVRLNALTSGSLVAGQSLSLPLEYSTGR